MIGDTVSLRNMETGEEIEVPGESVIARIRREEHL
jgi:hypothetical protein